MVYKAWGPLAAGFAGLPSTTSLVRLMHDLLDIDLPKTETRTNWLKRPLQPAMAEYAAADVSHLVELGERLLRSLDRQ